MTTRAWIFVTVLLLLNGGSNGKPFEDDDTAADYVTVACDNVKLLAQLTRTNIPYRCIDGTKERLFTKLENDPYLISNEFEMNYDEQSEESTLYEAAAAENRQTAGKPFRGNKCPEEGEIYIPELGECVFDKNAKPRQPGQPGQNTPSNTKKTRIPEFAAEIAQEAETQRKKKKPRDCPEGQVYLSEMGGCFDALTTRKRRSATNRLQQRSINGDYFEMNIPFFGEVVCRAGHVYQTEIGICLPISMAAPLERYPISIEFGEKDSCPPGTVYNSEIDHCSPYSSPMKTQHPEIKFFTKDQDDIRALYKTRRCPAGMAYISELHLCHAFQKPSSQYIDERREAAELNKQKQEAHLKTATEDPFPLKLLPLTKEDVGHRKCGENTVYVSELDICLEYQSP